jgi:hypothetical protein
VHEYWAVISPPPRVAVDEQLVACPETAQLTVPVGAGVPVKPVTVAVNVMDCPTVGLAGEAVTEMVGVNTCKLTAIVDEVVEL